MTAETPTPVDGTGRRIWIRDVTDKTNLGWCDTGSRCTADASFLSGPPHQYQAFVGNTTGSTHATTGAVTARSDLSVLRRQAWTVTLDVDTATGTLTATANQDVGATGGKYRIWIRDLTSRTDLTSCATGTTCITTTTFAANHDFRAYVASADGPLKPGDQWDDPSDVRVFANRSYSAPGWGSVKLPAEVTKTTSTNYATYDLKWPAPPLTMDDGPCGSYGCSNVGLEYYYVVDGQYCNGYCTSAPRNTNFGGVGNNGGAARQQLSVSSGLPQDGYLWIRMQHRDGTRTEPRMRPLGLVGNDVLADSTGFSADTGLPTRDPRTESGGTNDAYPATGCECADPVDTATGELFETVTDLELPGRMGVELTRTYSSQRAAEPGLLGYGWRTNLDMRADTTPVGATVTQENGAEVPFTEGPPGTFTPARGALATLTRAADGTWTYTRRGNDIFTFTAGGTLASHRDRNGETATVTRTATAITLTTPDGRALTVDLDAAGNATAVSGPGGRTVTYTRDPAGNLTAATGPLGNTWSYGYDTGHRMTTLTAPDGGTTTTTYGADGKVATNTDPTGATFTFAYTEHSTHVHTTRMTDPSGVVTDYHYWDTIPTGRVIDPDGTPARYDHVVNADGFITAVIDPTGATTRYTYDSRGNALTVTDPAGATTTMTYDGAGRLLSSTDADARTTTLRYDSKRNLVRLTEPLSGTATATTKHTRDATHPADVLTVTDPDGRVGTAMYTAAGFLASTTTNGGAKTTHTYNAYGQPLTTVAPRGNAGGATPADYTTTRVYDTAGQLTSVTDPLGRTTSFGYDPVGRTTTVTDPTAATTTSTYDLAGRVTAVTDPLGRTTTTTYDPAGRTTSVTDPSGATTTYGYDSHGWLATTTGPRGSTPGATTAERDAATVTYTRDLAGRVVATSQPDPDNPGSPLTATVTYSPAGDPVETTSPGGATSTATYDPLGRVATRTDPDGGTTSYGYDHVGHPTTVTDPDGTTTTTTYSPGGQITAVTDGAGAKTTFGYDTNGRLKSTVDPRGTCAGCPAASYTSSRSHDPNGNVASTTDQLGGAHTLTYDRADQLTQVTDPLGHKTSFTYTPAGQLKTVTGPDGGETRYSYDDAGQLVSRRSPRGNTWAFTYDAAGRPAEATDPLGRTRTTTWTLDGLVATVQTARGAAATDPATGTVTYTHDPLGQLRRVAFGDGTADTTFAYDRDGRRTAMTDAAGATSYAHTAAGRLAQVTRDGATWAYGYTPAGQLGSTVRPDGATSTWTYDAAGRPAQLVTPDGTTAFTSDPAGQLTAVARPDGSTESMTWDRAGYLASLATTKAGATLTAQTVTRDAAHNPTQVAVTRGAGAETRSFRYDVNDRLQGVCYTTLSACTGSAAATQWWTYDQDGNRLTEKNGTGTGTITAYTYDAANQLTTAQTGIGPVRTYTYDADGNELSDGDVHRSYDLLGRVRSVTSAGGTATYARDGDGVLRAVAGAYQAAYDWDVNSPVPLLATATVGGATTHYTYDPLGRVSSIRSGTEVRTVSHDPVGSPTDLLDAAGTITRSYDYSPFGAPRPAVGAPAGSGPDSQVRFGGLLEGPAGSLVARDRDFDPATARWTGVDPVAADPRAPFVSPYAYVDHRPGMFVDPLGDCKTERINGLCVQPIAEEEAPNPVWNGYWDGATGGVSSWLRHKGFGDPVDECAPGYGAAHKLGTGVGLVSFAGGTIGTGYRVYRGVRAAGSIGAYTSAKMAAAKSGFSSGWNGARSVFTRRGNVPEPGASGVAANAGSRLLSPGSLADEVVNATGGALKTNKGGFTVEIPHGANGITVRVMERGGSRTNYYRVSVPGKETYTVAGEASTDAALTHIGITESSLDDILSIVARIQGGG